VVCALLATACPTEEDSSGAQPIITQQPRATTATQQAPTFTGQTVTFPSSPLDVEATAADLGYGGSLAYQWYKADSISGGGTSIAGAKSSEYYPPINIAGTTFYYVVVSNNGSSTTSVRVPVQVMPSSGTAPETLIHAATPTVSVSGDNTYGQNVVPGDLVADATADDLGSGGVLSYQWYCQKDSVISPVGTNSPKYRPSTVGKGSWSYFVIVTNTNTGTNKSGRPITGQTTVQVKSNSATVTVN
jgi:hypothetical protein